MREIVGTKRSMGFPHIMQAASRVKEMLYALYFLLKISSMPATGKYVFVDIDNTVNNQASRLRRFTVNGCCDFKRANRFSEIIRDISLPGSVTFICNLSTHFRIVWFTSRGLPLMPATYYWLKKNGFPIYRLVCTGSMMRKIQFLSLFGRQRSIQFIIDDMKDGYEKGNPQYVMPFKQYLAGNGIKAYEELSTVNIESEMKLGEI
jgi:hypothetical protein